MKSRIKTKLLVFLALATLLINVFTSFSTVFVQAKTAASGYKIDVSYQNGISKLTGNSTAVLSGYQLTTLTDDSTGQQYNPNNFSMEVTKNGTYTFTLGYTLNGISTQAQSEKVEVVVDKLATGNAKEIQASQTKSIAELNARATETNLTVDAYAYETAGTLEEVKLNTTALSIPSGEFQNNIDDINAAIKDSSRVFVQAYLYRETDHSKIPLTAAWKVESNIYYQVQSADETAPVAYQAKTGESIRLYYKLVSNTVRKININDLTQRGMTNIKIDPTSENIHPGSWVVVSFTWAPSISKVNKINITDVTDVKVITDNSSTRQYAFRFKMPDKDVTITGSYTTKSGPRWVGLYDNSNLTFQNWELGYTAMAVTSTSNNPGTITDIVGIKGVTGTTPTKPYKTNTFLYRYWGGHFNDWTGALSANQPDYRTIQAYGRTITYGTSENDLVDAINSYPIIHDDKEGTGNSGNLVNGYYDDANVSFPVQDYTAGNPVYIGIQTKRGKPVDGKYASLETLPNYGYDKKTGYLYYPISTARIDVFPTSGTMTGKIYDSYSIKCYQNAKDYQAQLAAGVKNLPANSQGINGLYPVSTELPNGMQVVCIPVQYNPKSTISGDYGKGKNDMTLPLTTYNMIVYNAYDDFRVSITSNTSGANNWYRFGTSSGIDNISMNADTNGTKNDNVKKDYTVTAKEMPQINGYGYMKLDVQTKKGYTVPKPKLEVAYANNDSSSADLGKLDIQDKSTVGELGSTGSRNPLIFTKISAGDKFYNPNTGYRYYVWIDGGNGTTHTLDFTSEPIKFSYTFNELTNASGSNYNVDTKRYFSIPVTVPAATNKFFKGWQLKVTGKGIPEKILSNSTDNSNIYKPGDLVDIENIYDQIVDTFTYEAIANTEGFKITAEPQYGNSQQAVTAAATITRKYQTGYSAAYDLSEQKGPYQLLKDRPFRLSETVAPEYIDRESKKYRMNSTNSNTFIDNFKGSSTGTVNVSTLHYDRAFKVMYNIGNGSSTGIIPGINSTKADNKYYTLGSDTTTNTITLPKASQITPPSNKTFIGWKITSGNESQTFSKDKGTINLGSELNQSLAKALIDSSQNVITLEAQYEEPVAPITHVSNVSGEYGGGLGNENISNSNWSFEKTDYTISSKFKWNGSSIPTNAKEKIHYALYKQNPASNGDSVNSNTKGGFQLWKSDVKNSSHSSKVSDVTISEIDPKDKTFTITFTIKDNNGSIAYNWDNNARYVIAVWTSANGAGSFTDTDCPGNGTGNNEFDYSYPKIPYTTQITKVMKPITTVGASGEDQQITKKKYIYEGDKYSLQQTFNYDTRLTADELKQYTSIAFFKKNPGDKVTNHYLWYSTDKNFTNQGSDSSGTKAETPTITVNKDGTFTVKVSNIRDSTALWNSQAQYTLFVWNKSNGQGPGLISSESNNYTLQNPDSAETKKIPSLRTTMYVFKDTGSSGGSTNPDNFFTIPKNITLEEKKGSGTKTEISNMNPNLKIGIKGAWLKNDDKTQASGSELINPDDTDVLHDYRYKVSVSATGTQDPAIQLTQANTSKQITAYYYRYTNSNFEQVKQGNLQLGTIGFASNNDATSVRFGIKAMEDLSQIKTTDSFSGQAMFNFEQVPISTTR